MSKLAILLATVVFISPALAQAPSVIPVITGDEYRQNPARFNSVHLNKKVIAKGKIEYLDTDSFIFYNGVDGSGPIPSVSCVFNSPLITVNNLQHVKVEGTYVGLDSQSRYVTLKLIHCKIIPGY